MQTSGKGLYSNPVLDRPRLPRWPRRDSSEIFDRKSLQRNVKRLIFASGLRVTFLRTKPFTLLNAVKCFKQSRKSDNMTAVSSVLKYVVSLVVVFGILYVLISPLPEVDATFSGKSSLSYFVLVTHAFLGLFFLTFLMHLRPTDKAATAHGKVLDLICVRLC